MFKIFIEKISKFPVWVKHLIFIELKEEFKKNYLEDYFNNIKTDDIFQLYKPGLTFLGKKALKEKTCSEGLINFLEKVDQKKRIVDISVLNGWNLSTTAKYFVDCLIYDLIEKPESDIIKGTAFYLNGNIRLGEYFVNLNKITIEQLDEALRTQNYIEKSVNAKTAIAEILINLGYISKEETEGILLLKSECDNELVFEDSKQDIFTKNKKENEEIARLNIQVRELQKENKQLKEQLISVLKVEK